MKYLVVGSNGQLGSELRARLSSEADYKDHSSLDITNETAVEKFFKENSYDTVVNCAAYTAVDKAEDDKEAADRVNRVGPALLAKYGRNIIHISTDYVFDGTAHTPYCETDHTNPQSVYGSTKLAGEIAVLHEAQTAAIIRTSWLYSAHGNNFLKTMRRLGAERESLGVIFDQIGTPTYAGDLADAIVSILPQMKNVNKEIYHFSNEGVSSWYDFAVAIMELSNIKCKIEPIETKQYVTRAIRPPFSVLNKSKIKNEFGISIPHWMDGLRRCIGTLHEGQNISEE